MSGSAKRLAALLLALLLTGPAVGQPCAAPVQRGLRLLLLPPMAIPECPPPACESLAQCVEEAKQACTGSAEGTHILGDIVSMRDPKAVSVADAAASRALAAAYLSQDAATAEAILAPLQSSPDSATRYLAALAALHIRLRAGASPASLMSELDALAAIEAPFSTADVDYFRSLGHEAAGRDEAARNAAERALSVEPSFLNARLQHVRSSLKLLARSVEDPRACQRDLSGTIDSLYALMKLAPCPIQAAYVDAAFELDPLAASADPGLLLTHVALAALAGNRRAVAARIAGLRSAVGADAPQRACVSRMLQEAEAIGARTPPAQDPAR